MNKRLLDGGFGGKSWLGILINHWPSCWILTSLYSFIFCCSSLSCPPACLSPFYAYPMDISPPLASPLFGKPSSSFLPPSPLLFTHFLSLLLSTFSICVTISLFSFPLPHSLWFPSSRLGLLKALPSLGPPKDPLFLLCLLNWFCWGKKRYIYLITYLCCPLICVIFKKG